MNPIEALAYMDKVLAKLDPKEKQAREDEAKKEAAHRKEEGL